MFYAVDADEIGKRLEALLLANDADKAGAFSASVARSVDDLAAHFRMLGARIIFAAGDGLFAESATPLNLEEALPAHDGITWSVGIGKTAELATLALKKAKGLGRNRTEKLFYE